MGFGKFAKIFKTASGMAKPFVPGAAGSVLDIVNKSIANPHDEHNIEGLQALAEHVEEMGQAILILNDRLEALENK